MSTETAPVEPQPLSPEDIAIEAAAKQQVANAPRFDAEMRAQIARLLGTAATPVPAPAASDAA